MVWILFRSNSLHQVRMYYGENYCSGEILFSSEDRLPCTNTAPFGAGAHCDAPVIPELEISQRLRTGNTAQSQPGDAIAAGACLHAPKSVRIIQRISPEPKLYFFRPEIESRKPPGMSQIHKMLNSEYSESALNDKRRK